MWKKYNQGAKKIGVKIFEKEKPKTREARKKLTANKVIRKRGAFANYNL